MAKQSRSPVPTSTVRTRRTYFDFRFGQLHVGTAFPTSGGFDEGVTLFCLHSSDKSSRMFNRFLPEIAVGRSVYAPDFPGFGESDPPPGVPSPAASLAAAAAAVVDLAAELRLRQVDILGMRFGAVIALELAAARPELVRRLVLGGAPATDRLPPTLQETLVLRVHLDVVDDQQWTEALPKVTLIDLEEYADDLFEVAPKTLATRIAAFLDAKP